MLAGLIPDLNGATLCGRHHGHPRPRSTATTHPDLTAYDVAQFSAGHGPVFEAIDHGRTTVSSNITADQRWPTLQRRLDEVTPQAAFVTPVIDAHQRVCALALYSHTPLTATGAERVPLMVSILEVALSALGQHDYIYNLRQATISNRRVGIAVGILMAHHHFTDEEAFAALATASQALNRKVTDLADDVILTGELPTPPHAPHGLPAPRTPTP